MFAGSSFNGFALISSDVSPSESKIELSNEVRRFEERLIWAREGSLRPENDKSELPCKSSRSRFGSSKSVPSKSDNLKINFNFRIIHQLQAWFRTFSGQFGCFQTFLQKFIISEIRTFSFAEILSHLRFVWAELLTKMTNEKK